MGRKTLIWAGLFIGSTVGTYLPLLWGAGVFSISSVIFGALGGILGIWAGFKLGKFY